MIGAVVWTPERIEQLRALAASGITIPRAAAKLGTTESATKMVAQRNKIRFGGKFWTPDRVSQMRELANSGLSRREVAKQIGTTFDAIEKASAHYKVKFRDARRSLTLKIKPAPKCRPKFAPYRKPAPPSLGDRSDEIARFIAERGVTRCPPAYAAPSPQGALS